MNDTQLLERLGAAYATLDAPAPSASLAEVLDSGGIVADDDRHDAVVLPLVRPRPPVRPRTRMRVRHLVAATVATFVLFSGLAVAGALPDAVQREVSSVVAHLGIDLPNPESPPAPAPAPGAPGGSDRSSSTPASTATPTTPGGDAAGSPGPTSSPSSSGDHAAGATDTTTPAAGLPLGRIGTAPGTASPTPTTAPAIPDVPSGDGLLPPLPLPSLPLPLPPLPDPPVTVPQVTLPPLTVPQLTLPPITLPTLPLPLPLGLPALGL